MAVRGVTTKNDLVVIWGDKHPTEFNMAHDPFIEISRNNGESWTLLDSKLIINNAWITDESKIIASTNNEIYILGLDNTQKFLLSVNSNITGIDCTTNGKIAFLTEDGFVYSSIDYGMNWTKMKVPELSRAVQINHIGQIFLATNSQKILISNKSAEWINISLPDKLAQVQVINDNILCLFKDNSLRIYNLKLKDWKEVNNGTSISMLLKDHVNFYAFSEETGEVSVIMNGGDATGWTLGNIYKMEKGYLTSVKSSKGNIFLSAVPIYLWKPLK